VSVEIEVFDASIEKRTARPVAHDHETASGRCDDAMRRIQQDRVPLPRPQDADRADHHARRESTPARRPASTR
jgi:hypothetical protein